MSGGSQGRVVAVSVGLPRQHPEGITAIEKHPVSGPVRVTEAGIEGNACANTEVHGDSFMRVYAYAVEDYRWWAGQGLTEHRPGLFGEQLTTEGLDLNQARLGEIWQVGTAVLQIAHVRTPCQTFKAWMGEAGFDATAWVRRFTEAGRPGPYFRVLQEGAVAAGDEIVVRERPDHEVTVARLFAALTTRPDLLAEVAAIPGLKPAIYQRAEQRRNAGTS